MSPADKAKLDTLNLGDQTQTELANAPLKDTPIDGDAVAVVDSADGNALKRTTWARVKAVLKTYFDTLYSAVGHTHTKAQITDFAHSHGIGDLPVAAAALTRPAEQAVTDGMLEAAERAWSNADGHFHRKLRAALKAAMKVKSVK